jgi:hypothetical protein
VVLASNCAAAVVVAGELHWPQPAEALPESPLKQQQQSRYGEPRSTCTRAHEHECCAVVLWGLHVCALGPQHRVCSAHARGTEAVEAQCVVVTCSAARQGTSCLRNAGRLRRHTGGRAMLCFLQCVANDRPGPEEPDAPQCSSPAIIMLCTVLVTSAACHTRLAAPAAGCILRAPMLHTRAGTTPHTYNRRVTTDSWLESREALPHCGAFLVHAAWAAAPAWPPFILRQAQRVRLSWSWRAPRSSCAGPTHPSTQLRLRTHA